MSGEAGPTMAEVVEKFEALADLCRDQAHACGSGQLATLYMSFANSINAILPPDTGHA